MKNSISKFRVKKGFTQEEFANRLKINKFHLSRVENGKKNPSVGLLKNISEVLNVSIDDLLSGEKDLLCGDVACGVNKEGAK
jgi:putative transcriptional regulator